MLGQATPSPSPWPKPRAADWGASLYSKLCERRFHASCRVEEPRPRQAKLRAPGPREPQTGEPASRPLFKSMDVSAYSTPLRSMEFEGQEAQLGEWGGGLAIPRFLRGSTSIVMRCYSVLRLPVASRKAQEVLGIPRKP